MVSNLFIKKSCSLFQLGKKLVLGVSLIAFFSSVPLPAIAPQLLVPVASTAISAVVTKSRSSMFRRAGDIGQIALPLTGLGTAYYHNDQIGMLTLGKVLLLNQGLAEGLKSLTNVRRPNGGKRSFPSGHTAAAFAGAAFLSRRYGLAYGLPAYLTASVVGASRVYAREHSVLDVVAGAALGIGLNLLMTKSFDQSKKKEPLFGKRWLKGLRRKKRRRCQHIPHVSPYIGEEGSGVQVGRNW